MIRMALVAMAGLLLGHVGAPGFDDGPKYEPTERYESRQVEGWTVLVNKRFLADRPDLADRALALLRAQLYQVARSLPPKAVESLRSIQIWLEEDEPHHPCMAYHPDARWLRDHGMNPDKARCVEIANARNFLSWTLDQPWMVLHELAHGYHDQALVKGFGNDEVKLAFDRAIKEGKYQSVLRMSGKSERAYAATNPMEYFAEATEAFFGSNDYYPFVRPELKEHDPEMFALLGKLWGTDPVGRPEVSGDRGKSSIR
jgi:hypothetical protein